MNLSCKALPGGWTLHDTIDLQKNKKQFWAVQGISLAVAVVFFVIGWIVCNPVDAFRNGDFVQDLIALGVILVGMIVYIILHELTHGVFLYAFTKMKPKFGFVGWAAYCGNEAYCDKPRYAVVALAPLVFWGIVFGVLNIFFRTGIWFWVIWVLQLLNLSGAAGDIFVACKLIKYPKKILVQDTGVSMKVYRKMTDEELAEEARRKITEEDEKND